MVASKHVKDLVVQLATGEPPSLPKSDLAIMPLSETKIPCATLFPPAKQAYIPDVERELQTIRQRQNAELGNLHQRQKTKSPTDKYPLYMLDVQKRDDVYRMPVFTEKDMNTTSNFQQSPLPSRPPLESTPPPPNAHPRRSARRITFTPSRVPTTSPFFPHSPIV